jgi:hypothetical protein
MNATRDFVAAFVEPSLLAVNLGYKWLERLNADEVSIRRGLPPNGESERTL